jgi:hypothetical protein
MYCNFFVVKANNYSDDNNNNYLFFNVGTILINVWGDIDGAISSYWVSVHLAEGFQRRRLKCEKVMDDIDDGRRMTDDGRQVMSKAHIAFGKVS